MSTINTSLIADAISRHERIAFQFSGGRDSTAALYLLQPYWDRITVYHVDTGDQFPETQRVVSLVECDVQVVRVPGNSLEFRAQFGAPSDVVPVDNLPVGRMLSGKEVRIVSRYDCCFGVLMQPMDRQMKADGITLIIRGQRDSEFHGSPPTRSGHREGGVELLYPIQHWSGEDVAAYLAENSLPTADFYAAGMTSTPDCMSCTAWLGEGRLRYMQERYPVHHIEVVGELQKINTEVVAQLDQLSTALRGES